MSEPAIHSDYSVRLTRVVTWLTEHLDDTLDLARLADVACMSPCHFHRIYHALQGETWRLRCGGSACIAPAWS